MNPDLDRQPRQPSGRWPYPGDTPLVRARKVAQMYRARLRALSTDACDDADNAAVGFGETWVVPRVLTYTDRDWLKPADAADYLCISVEALRLLRTRGRIEQAVLGEDGIWRYPFAELRTLQGRRTRRRNDVVATPTPNS